MTKKITFLMSFSVIFIVFVSISLAKFQNIRKIQKTEQTIENTLDTNSKLSDNEIKKICDFIEANKDSPIIEKNFTDFIVSQCSERSTSDLSNFNYYINILPIEGTLYGLYTNNLQLQTLHNELSHYTDVLAKLSSNSSSVNNSDTNLSMDETNNNNGLQLISHKSVDGKIIGTIKNLTDEPYRYVKVDINLYDADGNQVDNTLANMNNLEANGTWNFTAYIVGDNVAKYRIVNIEGNR